MSRTRRLIGCLLGAGLALTPLAVAKPLTPELFVQLRFIEQTALSPDGTTLAYTVATRTPAAGAGERSEVWVRQNGEERRLLDRSADPRWSPDGKGLALLEASEEECRLKVWWAARGTWSVLRHAYLGPSRGGPAYCWLPDGRILAQVRLPAEPSKDALILDSKPMSTRATDKLVEWNPDTGNTQEWLEGVFTTLVPSPDGSKFATLKLGDLPLPNRARRGAPATLVVLDRSSGQTRTFKDVSDPVAASLRWSADNRSLAVRDGQGGWWSLHVAAGEARALPRQVRDCAWVGSKLAVLEKDWLLDGKTFLPGSTTLFGQAGTTLALTADQVVEVGTDGSTRPVTDLPGSGTPKLSWKAPGAALPAVITRGDQMTVISAGHNVRTEKAPAGLETVAVSQDGLVALSINPEHTHLAGPGGTTWAEQGSVTTNDQVLTLSRPSGQTDWLLLPPASVAGPYPVVMWLAPGTVYSNDSAPPETVLSNTGSGFNAHLLTAQGYAVYFPSLDGPLDSALAQALKTLRSEKRLDAGRVAVMGQSEGAEAALQAATQAHGFKAVIALNPFVQQTAWRASEHSSPDRILEAMHRPPTPQPEARNVQAPVLLVSGEVEEGHAGEFFAQLYREGKPARLVRYRNETGRVSKAEHVVHEWQQIYGWLERYLRAPVGVK
jgi:dipeptidyl aminopeptidase/acylaminoacyl peptidase